MAEDRLIDSKGTVHERSFTGDWKPRHGIFGSDKDTNWLGNPNTKWNIFGHPEEAREFFGQPVTSTSGNDLYHPSSSAGGSSGSDALPGLVGLLILGPLNLALIVTAATLKLLL